MRTYEEVVWLPEIDAGKKDRVGTVIGDTICYMGRHDTTEGEMHVFDRYTYEYIEGPSCDPSKNECSPVVIDGRIYRL